MQRVLGEQAAGAAVALQVEVGVGHGLGLGRGGDVVKASLAACHAARADARADARLRAAAPGEANSASLARHLQQRAGDVHTEVSPGQMCDDGASHDVPALFSEY